VSESPLQTQPGPGDEPDRFDELTAGKLAAGKVRPSPPSPGLDYAADERRAASTGWHAAARGLLRQPRFIVAAAFLLISAVGLNAATTFLKLHFRKVAVPLPVKSLTDETEGLPARLGPWAQALPDEPLNPDMEDALGTRQYVYRKYIDTRLDPHAGNILHSPTKMERDDRYVDFLKRHTQDDKGGPLVPVLTVGITYYTGLVDTVAHIPERCYIANGFEQASKDVETMPADGFADGKARDLKFTFINFDDQTNQEHGVFVAYFFQVNGKYTEDPIEVRKTLQDLTEKYGYYAKVEIKAASNDAGRVPTPEYRAAVKNAITDFIGAALPELEKRLPDWQRVKAGGR
jgi:hypothetical protein